MKIFIDGSCRGNPGPGGFGVVCLDENNQVIFCHQEQFQKTTNNEMELAAALYALAKFGTEVSEWTQPQIVYCDSAYTINTLTNWKNNWKANGWIKSDKKVPENLQLIQKYDKIEEKGYRIELKKVKGHSGFLGNEIADKLATNTMTEQEVMKKYGQ